MMKYFTTTLLCALLFGLQDPATARDVQAELQSLQQQKKIIRQVQRELKQALGDVGEHLKQLDTELLAARKAYRQVRQDIAATDKKLKALTIEKESIKQNMQVLYKQMLKEANAAYRHRHKQSVWADMLSGTPITELPHRQYLLKQVMLSQEKDRLAWQVEMNKLTAIERKEQANKAKLIALQQARKDAEQALVSHIAKKKEAAKSLRSSLRQKKAQEKRLIQQEKALKRLLDGLADTLLASDKREKLVPIRKQKGRLPWPIQGSIMVGFKQQTPTGVKLSGVHLAPKRRDKQGRLVQALGQGQVRYADWFGGYGLMMIVDYGQGIVAVYAHNDALYKQVGDWVEQGEILAEAGSTGWVDDIRLYFEIRDQGKPVNPTRWCTKQTKRQRGKT